MLSIYTRERIIEYRELKYLKSHIANFLGEKKEILILEDKRTLVRKDMSVSWSSISKLVRL